MGTTPRVQRRVAWPVRSVGLCGWSAACLQGNPSHPFSLDLPPPPPPFQKHSFAFGLLVYKCFLFYYMQPFIFFIVYYPYLLPPPPYYIHYMPTALHPAPPSQGEQDQAGSNTQTTSTTPSTALPTVSPTPAHPRAHRGFTHVRGACALLSFASSSSSSSASSLSFHSRHSARLRGKNREKTAVPSIERATMHSV